jgi:hypothetical protein
MSRNATGAVPYADEPTFFDDFSESALARYYDITPGIGKVVRGAGGLRYEIVRAPDGPASAADYLSIDSLGRPQSPTARVLFRFTGTARTFEACVEYDFHAKRNGRTSYLWLAQGGPEHRFLESIALVRGADLDPASHSLTLQVYEPTAERQSISLPRTPADKYWLRVAREQSRLLVSWSTDGQAFVQLLERNVQSPSPAQTIVINSSSFAGGASFVVRSIRLSGVQPDPFPERPPVFAVAGHESKVSAAEIVTALKEGRDIDLRGCAIDGTFDLAQAGSSIPSNIQMQDAASRDLWSRPPLLISPARCRA